MRPTLGCSAVAERRYLSEASMTKLYTAEDAISDTGAVAAIESGA